MTNLLKDIYITALANEIDALEPLIDMHRILNKYADTLDSDEEETKFFLDTWIGKIYSKNYTPYIDRKLP